MRADLAAQASYDNKCSIYAQCMHTYIYINIDFVGFKWNSFQRFTSSLWRGGFWHILFCKDGRSFFFQRSIECPQRLMFEAFSTSIYLKYRYAPRGTCALCSIYQTIIITFYFLYPEQWLETDFLGYLKDWEICEAKGGVYKDWEEQYVETNVLTWKYFPLVIHVYAPYIIESVFFGY